MRRNAAPVTRLLSLLALPGLLVSFLAAGGCLPTALRSPPPPPEQPTAKTILPPDLLENGFGTEACQKPIAAVVAADNRKEEASGRAREKRVPAKAAARKAMAGEPIPQSLPRGESEARNQQRETKPEAEKTVAERRNGDQEWKGVGGAVMFGMIPNEKAAPMPPPQVAAGKMASPSKESFRKPPRQEQPPPSSGSVDRPQTTKSQGLKAKMSGEGAPQRVQNRFLALGSLAAMGSAKGKAEFTKEDSLNPIDRLLSGLRFGTIAFNVPPRMNIQATAVVQLLLGLEKTGEELKAMVEAEGTRESGRIRVSNRMEARLTGPHFTITAITPEVQAVSGKEISEWKWEIKPRTAGTHHLHLTLSAILEVEGSSTPRSLRTFDKMILVEVGWLQKVRLFVSENWKWLWAAILAPIGGWFWRTGRKSGS
ncbi:MAG: hypothetical protein H5U10_08920 [Desulfacinum sp.]|nr:hypothetical protein [Desulfacinum sp.]